MANLLLTHKYYGIMALRELTSDGRLAVCRCVDERKRTLPGLAMTPQQIAEMQARGIPISSRGMQEYYDEIQSATNWNIEPMFKRGSDINQLWEMEKDAQERVLSARKKDIRNFGK